MRLLLVAPPGSGKGTQARRLSERYGIEHISSGDLLRRQVALGTELGKEARAYLDRGDLVPDHLIADMVVQAVTAADARGGFLLDGYPRNLSQAKEAEALARNRGLTLDGAVYLDVHRAELLRRLLGRAGAESRGDDVEATIRHRLDVYDSQTHPLVDYYAERGLLIPVDGEQPVAKVTEDIVDAVEARRATR